MGSCRLSNKSFEAKHLWSHQCVDLKQEMPQWALKMFQENLETFRMYDSAESSYCVKAPGSILPHFLIQG